MTVETALALHRRKAALSQASLRIVILVMVFVYFAVVESQSPLRPVPLFSLYAAYTVWGTVLLVLTVTNRTPLSGAPAVLLLVDIGAMTALLTIHGGFTEFHRGEGPVLLDFAYYLIPVLAAFQIRPGVTAGIAGTSALAWCLGAGLTTSDPDWGAIAVVTLPMCVLGAACVLLSWVQQSRVRAITELAIDRSRLLAEMIALEERERQALAEELHDGALQLLLAARQDLSEVQETTGAHADDEVMARLAETLAEASRNLRATTSSLHPAVLEHTGLVAAVRSIVQAAAKRGGFEATFELTGFPGGTLPAEVEKILFGAARELLTNVVKHAQASRVTVRLTGDRHMIRLAVIDDGVGITSAALKAGLAHGHIGVASQQIRLENAGGTMSLRAGPDCGTVAEVAIPV